MHVYYTLYSAIFPQTKQLVFRGHDQHKHFKLGNKPLIGIVSRASDGQWDTSRHKIVA